jgi:GT2 family glycosyltransferase
MGYSQYFDHFEEEQSSDIDVLFMGCYTPRRARYLASASPVLNSARSRIILSDNSRPNTGTSSNFVAGEDKISLLTRSAILLNLHQADEPYFEWFRVLDAIHCGCVVATEHSTDYAPLVPGTHFASSRPETLRYLIADLIRDPPHRARIRRQAYEWIRSELPLSDSARALAEAAEAIGAGASPCARTLTSRHLGSVDELTHVDFAQEIKAARVTTTPISPVSLFPQGDPEIASLRRVLKEVRLDLMDLRRVATKATLAANGDLIFPVRQTLATPSYGIGSAPRVSIVTALYNHQSEIVEALDSLLQSPYTDWEIVVVNDGSSDGSEASVARWAVSHPEIRLLLLTHPINRGLGFARNTALDHARGEYSFILDSDNAVYPEGIGDLVSALEQHADASFAFGMLASFKNSLPYGMVSYYPWEPTRLQSGNFVDAMAMFRTDVLRALKGYSIDRRLYGWEDYDLYCRLAEGGHNAVFVDHFVASYRASDTSMLSVTNISYTTAYIALKEHAPTLMSNVVPPD